MRGRDEIFSVKRTTELIPNVQIWGGACEKHRGLFLHHNQGKPFLMEMAQVLATA